MSRTGWLYAFTVAVAVQCAALYIPRAPSVATGLPLDKVVHVTLFAVVAALGVRAAIPVRWLAAGLIAQAVLSEVVQGIFLPHRSGDLRDLAADLAGIAAGLIVGSWWMRRAEAASSGPGREASVQQAAD